MINRISMGLALASLLTSHAAYAQAADAGRPDEGNSWKYFFFHNPDVSEEKAREDIIECRGYASGLQVMRQGSTPTYTSVPYTGGTNLSPAASALAGGLGALAGAIIVGFMDAGDRRAMERANLRRCFGFKGYDRYEMSKEDHKALFEGESEEVRARLVAMVTGPKPEGERLVP